MLEILMPTLWGCFIAYSTWYFTSAKHYAPITLNEAKILWKIHKQSTRCNAEAWREIRSGDEIIGFECECGYKHIQKRPIVANTPVLQFQSQTQTIIYDKLHKP
jgi:hypothetical protein